MAYHYIYMNKVRKRIHQTMNSWLNVGRGKKGRTNMYVSILLEVLGLVFSFQIQKKRKVTHLKRKTELSPTAAKETWLTFSERIYSVKSNTIISVNAVFMELFSPLINVYWIRTICKVSSFIPSGGFLFSLRTRTYHLRRHRRMKTKRLSVKWLVQALSWELRGVRDQWNGLSGKI